DEEAGRPYVEPAHDALVRHWDKMAEWQRMAGDSLPFQRRLSQAAWEWSQLAKRTGALAGWWQTLAALVRSWLQRWSLIAPEQAAGLVWDDEIRSSQLSQLLASPAGAWLSRIEREFARASIEQRQLNRRLRATVLTLLVTLLLAATVAAGV